MRRVMAGGFQDSRQWCFLSLKLGADPLKALVETFLDTWQFAATDPERVTRQHGWMEALHGGKATLGDLIDATERRRKELDQPEPPGFFLYVDQGEELYVRAEQRQRQRFSEILAHALPDSRLRMMMSMRSDFFGDLQKDEALFAAIQSGQSSNRVLCHFDEDGVFLQSDACIHTRARASRRRFSRGNG